MLKKIIKLLFHYFKQPSSRIYNSNISLDTVIGKKVKIFEQSIINSTIIGDYTYIGEKSNFTNTIIGSYCSVGTEVLCGIGEHPTDYISTYPGFYTNEASGAYFMGNIFEFASLDKPKTIIGSDVWIGSRVIILSGIKISDGVIIGAGSIVAKDIPPYAIVAGVPAKIIKYRFDEDLILKLLESKWWNLPIDKLKKASHSSNDPIKFLKQLEDSI